MSTITSRARGRAFSLVEVIVAFSILVLAVIPMITLFTTSAQQTRQTGDYALAIMLQERVAEDLRIAAWENPHAPDDPRVAGDGTKASVVDGKSVYFRGLEDSAAPFGQIDDADRVIDATYPDLYGQLKSYQFAVKSARRQLATQGDVLDVDLEMEWTDGTDQRRGLPMHTVVPLLRPNLTDPPQVRDRAQADANIHKLLFGDRPQSETLDQAATATGADAAVVRALGDVMLVMGSLAITRTEYVATRAQLAAAVTKSVDPTARFRARAALGRYLEARTAAYVQAIEYLGDKVALLAKSTEAQLGNPAPDPLTYSDELVMASLLPRRMAESVAETAGAYADAYNDDAGLQMPRVRTRVFMKVLELSKIEALTSGSADPGYPEKIVTTYNAAETGRNVNFAAYGQTEATLCGSVESMRAAFATPGLLDSYGAISTSGPPAVAAMVFKDNGRNPTPASVPVSAPTTGAAAPTGATAPSNAPAGGAAPAPASTGGTDPANAF